MKKILSVFLCCICYVAAQDCSLGTTANSAYPNDIDGELVVHIIDMENMELVDITISQCNGYPDFSPYAEVLVKTETELQIITKNMEEWEKSVSCCISAVTVCLQLTTTCPDGIEVTRTIYSQITDTNQHDPIIMDEDGNEVTEYTYLIPLPFPPTIDITQFGKEIRIKDIDFSNDNFIFETSKPEIIEFKYEELLDPPEKIHQATFSFKSMVQAPIEFELTISDVGNPTRTDLVAIKISSDPSLSLPSFSETFYEGNIQYATTNIETDKIELNDVDKAEFRLEGNGAAYFETPTLNGKEVIITLKEPMVIVESYTYLTLYAIANNGEMSTTVIYNILKDDFIELEFSDTYYKGSVNYDETDITMEPITLTGAKTTTEVKLEGDKEDYFKATLEGNNVKIIVEKPIDFAEVYIDLTLTATDIGTTANTLLMINIINTGSGTISFSKQFYDGTAVSGTMDVIIYEAIEYTGPESPIISLTGEHVEYFKYEFKDNIITIQASKPIEIDATSTNLILSAEKDGEITSSMIIINIISVDPEVPKFVASVYEGEVNFGTTNLILSPIELSPADVSSLYLKGDTEEYFEDPVLEGGVINLKMIKPMDIEESHTSLTLYAQKNGVVAYTVIVISVIKENTGSLQFSEPYYKGNAKFESDILEMEDAIELKGATSTVSLELSGDHETYFEAEYDDVNGVVSLTLSRPIDFVQPYTELTISAKSGSETADTLVVIYIEHPPTGDISFTKSFYEGSAEYDSPNLKMHDTIELVGTPTADLTLEGTYKNLFTPTIEEGIVTLVPTGNIKIEEPSAQLTLTAEYEGDVATTVILINVIKVEPEAPKFQDTYYEGQVDYGTQNFVLNKEIELTSTNTPKLLLDGESASYFDEPTYEGGKVLLELNKNFDIDKLHTLLTLYAESNGFRDETVIIVNIIKETTGILEFSEPYYKGNAKFETTDLVLESEIILKGAGPVVDIVLLGDYETYFEAEYESGIVTLKLSTEIDFPELYTELTISAKSGGETADTLVVIYIEHPPTGVISFTKSFYEASAEYDSTILDIHDTIELTGTSTDNAILTLDGKYKNLFSATIESGIVTLKVEGNIKIEEPYTQLSLTAEYEGDVATTIIFITVIKVDPEAPKFQETYYEGKVDYGTQNFNLDKDIELTSTDIPKLSLVGESASYFDDPTYEGGKVLLELNKNFDIDKLHTLLTLYAESNGFRDETVIVVNIIKQTTGSLEFVEPYYKAGAVFGEANLDVEGEIILKGAEPTVTFALDGEYATYFDCNLKNEVVELTLNQPIDFGDLYTDLTIEAKKDGVIAKTFVMIYIEQPTEGDIKFEKSFYEGSAEYDTQNLKIQEPIKLLGTDTATVTLEGDHAEFFKTSFNDGIVTIEAEENIKIEEKYTQLTLTAEDGENVATTIILINILQVDPKAPKFAKPSYEGNIDYGTTVLDIEDIELSSDSNPRLYLEGESAEYFNVPQFSNGKVTLELNKPFEIDETHTSLILYAESNEIEVYTVIVISIKKVATIDIEFSEQYYKGSIEFESAVGEEVNMESDIELNGATDSVILEVEGEYSTYFTADFESGIIKLKLNKAMDLTESYTDITIKATEGGDIAETVIMINIIQENSGDLDFTKPFYEGSVVYGTTNLNIPEDIELIGNNPETATVEIQEQEYKDLFICELEGAIVILKLKDTIEITEPYIHLTLLATNSDGEATTLIIIKIITTDPDLPQFSQSIYEGNINYGSTELKLDTDIILTNAENPILRLEGESESYFDTPELSGNKVTLKVNKAFNIDKTHTSLTLYAEDSDGIVNTVIVISIIKESTETMEFVEPIYKGTAEYGSKIINTETIELKGATSDVELILDGDRKEYFDAKYESGIVTIEILTNIDFVEPYTELTLTANLDGVEAKTVIMISITQTEPSVIEFSKPFYEESAIDGTTNLIMDEEITLTGTTTATFDIQGDFASSFKATLEEDGKVILELLEPITVTGEYTQISLTADSEGEKASTVVIVKMIKSNPEDPSFSEPYFEGKVDFGDTNLDFDVEIKLTAENPKLWLSGESEHYFKEPVFNSDEGEVTLELAVPIDLAKAYTYLTLYAQSNDMIVDTVLIINIIQESAGTVEFEEQYYKGSVVYNTKNLQMETDIILKGTTSADLTLTGDHSTYFNNPELSGDKVILSLKDEIDFEGPEIDLILSAISGDATAVTSIFIIIKPETGAIEFSESFYEGEVEFGTKNLEINNILLIGAEVAELELNGDYKEYFEEPTILEGEVTLTLTKDIDIAEPFIYLTLLATVGTDKASAIIIIEILKDSPETMEFSEPIYEGDVDFGTTDLTMQTIELLNGDGAILTLTGETAEYFKDPVLLNGIVTLELKEVMDIEKAYTYLSLVAENDDEEVVTMILININSAPVEPPTGITFKPYIESMTLSSYHTGLIYAFTATSSNDEDVITYSTTGYNEVEINPTDGILSVKDSSSPLTPGTHEFQIKAVGSKSNEEKEIKIKITVYLSDLCEDERILTKSLISMTQIENVEATILKYEDDFGNEYQYCIESQFPEEDLFSIDENGDVVCNKLDREAEYFTEDPYFTVKIKLQKKSEACVSKQGNSNPFYLPEGSVENSPTTTVLMITVDDDNDHKPEFVGIQRAIGYPAKEIADLIKPVVLTKVKAVDLDVKDKIKYSTDSTACTVDEDSGFVYPTEAIYTTAEIKIKASDGKVENDVEQTIKINIIDESKISVLKINGVTLEDLEEKLAELSEEAGYELRYFTASVLPNNLGRSSRADEDFYLEAYVYAMDGETPVDSSTLMDELEDVEDLDISNYAPEAGGGSGSGGGGSSDGSDTGLIAGISVLAVLLVLVICGTIALWYFKIRKTYQYYSDEEDIIPAYKQTSEDSVSIESASVRRPTGFVFNPPPPESDDSSDTTSSSSNSYQEINETTAVDQAKERRKSVTFIADVEKIKIEGKSKDDEDDDDDDDKESDNESVKQQLEHRDSAA